MSASCNQDTRTPQIIDISCPGAATTLFVIIRNLPLDLVHIIVDYFDENILEDESVCRNASLIHRPWTRLVLLAAFGADFPRCISAPVSLSMKPHPTIYGRNFNPGDRFFTHDLAGGSFLILPI
jgi:hypothetical protein